MCLYLSFSLVSLLIATDGGAMFRAEAAHPTAQVQADFSRKEARTLPPPYLHLPVFVDSNLPLVQKEHFSPARGSRKEPLPEAVRGLLIPAALPGTSPPSTTQEPVKTWCWRSRMHVQVERSLLGTGESQPQLRLGTCQTSNSNEEYLYFDYDFDTCGTKRTVIGNQVAYINTLRYDPPKLEGPIRRAVPFNLPVACSYNRYQYSYKIGYKPKMQMRKIFKSMNNRAKFSLTPRNAQWERLSPSDQYVLGKPMYFEAEAPSMSVDKRLYVHSCYVTSDKSHTSTLQFPVVKNFGCMVESKESHSRFIPYKNNAVRFSLDAFLFKGMTDQLYMHCDMSVGSSVPSPTAKSCNYDLKAGRWVELFGSDSVCTCCDSSCRSTASPETKTIISKPWTIEPKVKPTATPKRKRLSTTAATTTTTTTTTTTSSTTTATAPPQPETTRKVTERSTRPQPEEKASTQMGKVKNKVKEWPFGGGGVTWVEMEEYTRSNKLVNKNYTKL
ncbi:zona pellucida sperm-binding protein 3d.2 [Pleuronectes platessa]|uniref:zona pellucida sperm-binding protein 3d.2 n=1 Tax=Pleuronectes platessa TaxID=8262 RepID=UPI00232A60CD|nr:zona pellucida sperm-binding protein 3d.2 [Pleuronectes platessa]